MKLLHFDYDFIKFDRQGLIYNTSAELQGMA